MYDPDSYDAYSEFQRQDARELIPHITSRMDWRKADRILDFGCGSGFITKNVLRPLLQGEEDGMGPLIYGVDLSQKMIDFASVKYPAPNLIYMMADVMKDDCEFPCKFDKIFSFHVMHWILDQE
jgi:trans-aconitate methyltransferase